MSQNGTGRGDRDRNENASGGGTSTSDYLTAGAVAAGLAAVAGGIYWFAKGSPKESPKQANTQKKKSDNQAPPEPQQAPQTQSQALGYITNLISRMGEPGGECSSEARRKSPPPANPSITNLNSLLSDIYVRFLQIEDSDFQLHYKVYDQIFHQLHQKMKLNDPYYGKYSSTVQFAGSHYDNLRIKKHNEFDVVIVLDLPLNFKENPTNPADSDIFIEPKTAGHMQLKMGVQFRKLPMRDGLEWNNNKAAYEWMDDSHYLLRSRFLDWFKSVVAKALNKFDGTLNLPTCYVDGVPYTIRKSESGPALTLIIENKSRGFRLDVDLVPALRFPESRWPTNKSYRAIPAQCSRGSWLVVGKPDKSGSALEQARSWRMGVQAQETALMHNSFNLRQAVRLIKKLRDSLGMTKIASYYIKTLFLWEIVERNDQNFWQRSNPADLFKLMVSKFHAALVNKKIPYFWNKNSNLLGKVDERTLFQYAAQLVPLIQILGKPEQYKQVAKYILNLQEFRDYNARFLHI